MSKDWFRNTSWNDAIARSFYEKLARAGHKEQYLRIQASHLVSTHPDVSVDLLNQYFELPDQFDQAQAYVDRARALLRLGHIEAAIESYEAALAREASFPSLQTQAWLDLPFLIATRRIAASYERAVELLETFHARLMFPIDHFKWHAAQSLIAAERQDHGAARHHALLAIESAESEDSGYPHHRSVGLVGEQYLEVRRRLERYGKA